MTNSQCATEPGLADTQAELTPTVSEGASRPLKRVLIGFAATVTIGLGLASWYVGVRIVDANEVAPVSAPMKASLIAPPKVSMQPPAPSPEDIALAEAYWKKVPPPDLYLQVAGLGRGKDAGFIRALEAKGYRARIIKSDPSSTDQEESRILIGPFVGRSSLAKAERKLQSAGVLAIETAN